MRASSAVPAVFQPVKIGPREYVDGGLSAPVPVHHARAMGAEFVIAVDISAVPQGNPTSDLARMLMQTFAIMGRSIKGYELRDADLVLVPKLPGVAGTDFSTRQAVDPRRPRGGAGADRRAARAAGGQGEGVVAGLKRGLNQGACNVHHTVRYSLHGLAGAHRRAADVAERPAGAHLAGLKATGCATLREGVYILPTTAASSAELAGRSSRRSATVAPMPICSS